VRHGDHRQFLGWKFVRFNGFKICAMGMPGKWWTDEDKKCCYGNSTATEMFTRVNSVTKADAQMSVRNSLF